MSRSRYTGCTAIDKGGSVIVAVPAAVVMTWLGVTGTGPP